MTADKGLIWLNLWIVHIVCDEWWLTNVACVINALLVCSVPVRAEVVLPTRLRTGNTPDSSSDEDDDMSDSSSVHKSAESIASSGASKQRPSAHSRVRVHNILINIAFLLCSLKWRIVKAISCIWINRWLAYKQIHWLNLLIFFLAYGWMLWLHRM